MTRTVPHRELRNDSSRLLREVAAGESFQITNHGEIVALLVPPDGPLPALAMSPPRRQGGFGALPRTTVAEPTADVLDELRGEER